MQIFIRTLTGSNISLECEPHETVDNIKAKIHDKQGVERDAQRLVYRGKPLDDGSTLADHDITNEAVIHLVTRLR